MAAPKQFAEITTRAEVLDRVLELKEKYPIGILSEISVGSLFEIIGISSKEDLFKISYKIHQDG